MKIEISNQLKIKLKGEDSENFKSILSKIQETHTIIGFNKSKLNNDEINLIKKINNKLK